MAATPHPTAPISAGEDARRQLLAGLRVSERRIDLAGITTAVVEGGEGRPLVLLHGPGGNATHWSRVLADLVTTHHVIVPDLPGHGASDRYDGQIDADRALTWLGELIDRTCGASATASTPTASTASASAPTLAGYALGGALAARYAAAQAGPLATLVLVDTLGLVPFEPAPAFGLALHRFVAEPTPHTHDELWQQCASDLDLLRQRMGADWEPFKTYNVDRISTPSVQAALVTLMGQLGVPQIPPDELSRIAVPTHLIWGRLDRATPVAVAAEASARYGWPLHVIENCADDPPVEAPEAFVQVLRQVLDDRNHEGTRP